jgi:hypothetical protein
MMWWVAWTNPPGARVYELFAWWLCTLLVPRWFTSNAMSVAEADNELCMCWSCCCLLGWCLQEAFRFDVFVQLLVCSYFQVVAGMCGQVAQCERCILLAGKLFATGMVLVLL